MVLIARVPFELLAMCCNSFKCVITSAILIDSAYIESSGGLVVAVDDVVVSFNRSKTIANVAATRAE